MWQRRVEIQLLQPIQFAFRHVHPAMAEREVPQVKDWGEANKAKALYFLTFLDGELAHRSFVALDRFTVADITAIVAIDFHAGCPHHRAGIPAEPRRWRAEVSARPAAAPAPEGAKRARHSHMSQAADARRGHTRRGMADASGRATITADRTGALATEGLDDLLRQIRACRICRDAPLGAPLHHEPRPGAARLHTARILVASQAPGTKVHLTGLTFNDASGDRLRDWMGVTREEFYDESRVAIIPMGLCFPARMRRAVTCRRGGSAAPRGMTGCSPGCRPSISCWPSAARRSSINCGASAGRSRSRPP